MSIWRTFLSFFWGDIRLSGNPLFLHLRKSNPVSTIPALKRLFVSVSVLALLIAMPFLVLLWPDTNLLLDYIHVPMVSNLIFAVLLLALMGIPIGMTVFVVTQSRYSFDRGAWQLVSVTPLSDQSIRSAFFYTTIDRFRPLWIVSFGLLEFVYWALASRIETTVIIRYDLLSLELHSVDLYPQGLFLSLIPSLCAVVVFYSVTWLAIRASINHVLLWETRGMAILYALPLVLLSLVAWIVPVVLAVMMVPSLMY